MQADAVARQAFAMPLISPAYAPGPYHFVDREFFVITYHTDPDALRERVPEPLMPAGDQVKFEFIRMPDSTGFDSYTESGQVIPVTYQGQPGTDQTAMYLDDEAPIAGGREIWGFPKHLAKPTMSVVADTLLSTLDYGPVRIATGTMGYKHRVVDRDKVLQSLRQPNYLLKIMPDVDCTPRICELVVYGLENLVVKGAWEGPAALELHAHALAPVADLPVGSHLRCPYTHRFDAWLGSGGTQLPRALTSPTPYASNRKGQRHEQKHEPQPGRQDRADHRRRERHRQGHC